MEKFGRSQPVTRREDMRFLTGKGRYVDDVAPREALFGFFLRSTVAHARLNGVALDDARAVDGVHLVLGVDDLLAAGLDINLSGGQVTNRDGTMAPDPERPLLAREKLRHVGEAVAFIVADTLEAAKDASELIEIDYEDLPAHMGLATGGAEIHAGLSDNIAFDWAMGDEAATQAAFDNAAHRVKLEVGDNRVIVNSIEPRGCFAEWENDRLHVAINGQGVWGMKDDLIKHLHLDRAQVRVTNPDVGGGFGMKAMRYPEYFVIAHAARQLGRSIRWMAERTESMLSDNAGRDLISWAEMAFDENYKITAYRVETISNLGAYNSQFAQFIQTQLFSRVLMGTYNVQTTWLRVQGIYTNTTPVDAYRGAGRPEAIYVLERIMDRAARELGIDSNVLRRRNFIAADAFPYLSCTGETYDVGDFARVLTRAEQNADMAGYAKRKSQDAAHGLLRGQGVCYYIESILGEPDEGAHIAFNADGSVSLFVGTQSNGQGHETVYAQFLHDQTGIPVDKINIIQGDSDLIAKGGGTGGSRSVTTQNTATLATIDVMIAAFRPYLAHKMNVDESSVIFDHETFRATDSNMTPSLLEVAEMARQDGRAELLSHKARARIDGRSFPNGAHIAEIVIDPETGVVKVDRYTVVDDFGNMINPRLAEGQVHGGVVQGIGQALSEQVTFDEDGQLLTATFMDYAMPRAADIPMISFDTEPVPSTANVLGMKGCGEAGTVGALAAVANAVQDALWARGLRQVDMPFTPNRIWEMLNAHEVAAE